MKTTIDLPVELVTELEHRARDEGRTLSDLVSDLLHQVLRSDGDLAAFGPRVQFPIIECAPAADPRDEITPDRVAAVLTDFDALEVR